MFTRFSGHSTEAISVPTAPPLGRNEGERLAGAVSVLAALASLAIVVTFPVAYFLSAHDRLAGALEVRAQIYANVVSDATGQSPVLWNAFLGDRTVDLSGFDIATPDDGLVTTAERRRVLGRDGRVIIDIAPAGLPSAPVLRRTAPVLQNGNVFGEVEITRSLRPITDATISISVVSGVFGLFLMAALRTVPLRLMRRALQQASYLSAHDQLTGLPNRALMADRLEQALGGARRSGGQVAVFFLDLDHFKDVNDTLGHAAGDLLLRAVTVRLRSHLRETDTLGRLGGDEFAVIQPGVRDTHDAELLAQRLIEAMRAPIVIDGQQAFVGLSVGIALGGGETDAAELIKQADVALYQAKAAGRGGHCFFAPEMNARLKRRHAMEKDLRAALARHEFALHYQPQIDVASGRIKGAEALMRWNRDGEGLVSPAVFIPLAEGTGLIAEMGAWSLMEACREAATWPNEMHVAVNVSPVQFRLSNFPETVRRALAASGLAPGRLEIEVTEGILLNDTEETLEILAALRRLGVRLAMDDFGTGYASLSYLQKFRFDKIKIDQSFIRSLGADINAAAIVRAVVGLSGALGMTTNAEGVEKDEQMELLRAYGCHEVQGFLYGTPMPAVALRALMVKEADAA